MEATDSMEAMEPAVDAELARAFGKFYKVSDVALLMKVSAATIYDAIATGDLEAVAIGGPRGALRVGHASFKDYLKRRNTRSRALARS